MSVIWFMNLAWLIREVLKHTPNWRDEDVDSDEIVQNFMTNTPMERLEFIQKIGQINPMIGLSGVMFLLFALIL